MDISLDIISALANFKYEEQANIIFHCLYNVEESCLDTLLPIIKNCKSEEAINYIEALIKRVNVLNLSLDNYIFLLEKIANKEYLKQFKSYLEIEQKRTNQIETAIKRDNLDLLISNLESCDNPDEKLLDVLNQKMKNKRI